MSLLPVHIPSGFTLTVQSGDTLTAGQIIAKRSENSREKHIPLARLLGVTSKKAAKYLRKSPGDVIKNGEIIAVKSSFISNTEVVSEIAGTLLRFDRETGDIVVEKIGEESESEAAEIIAPFDGVVTESSKTSVVLKTRDGGLIGIRGTGGSGQGQLILVESEGQSSVEGAHIAVVMIGNIVLGKVFTKEALVKASGMGVSGVITLKINDEDIAVLEQKRMLLPILEVDSPTWEALAKQVGKKVYLDSVAKTILVS